MSAENKKTEELSPETEAFFSSLRDGTWPEDIGEDILDMIEEVITKYESYSSEKDESERIRRAFVFAYKAHSSQKRKSGEPYIIHPIATAQILTELEVDADTLVAALLHDTVEDTQVTIELITEVFGEDVALLVDGVTKLGRIAYSSREEQQAENMRKMFLAMAKDIRVILIKLADRLHNMRTMKHQNPERQKEIAKETLDIYAPLAHRLGIYKIKWELEDLCLRYTDPDAYYELVGAISQKRSEREKFLATVVDELSTRVSQMGIKAEIEGRPKHFYSIYNKMKNQDKHLDQIYDIFACRIIVDTVSDCYAVLGLVHEMYYPMPGRFKDYIAMPKPNMYQSLHTTVIGKEGVPFEVQIRTLAMHRTAEYGIAAHWKYKESGSSQNSKTTSFDNKLSWLRQILDWQGESKDAGEYLDSLKTGLVAEEVFVFTPKGDVFSLPLHSCPIDLAYTIHSGIGNRMYGAKVNGRIVPLSYEVQNGDIIEILTSEQIKGPSRDWLKMVKTSAAKSKINAWFKRASRDENILLGKESLEREMKKLGFTPQQLLQKEHVEVILKKTAQNTLDDLYAAIGYGVITAQKVVGRLRDEYIKALPEDERFELGYRVTGNGQVVYQPLAKEILDERNIGSTPAAVLASNQERGHSGKHIPTKDRPENNVVVTGIDNCLVHLSRCCNPLPGDEIIGYITRGNGVGVHRKDCSNIRHIVRNATASAKAAERASRLIEVYWSNQEHSKAVYPVEFTVIAHDRRHLLADISNAIAEERIPITSAQMAAMKDITARFTMTIEVKDQEQLDRVLGRIKAIRDVIEVRKGS